SVCLPRERKSEETKTDRSTLDGSLDASVKLLKPASGLNSKQEVQTIMMGNQESDSSGDFHGTFTGPNLEAMPSQSRSRRSWIWNQFFVIEEYSGPEPVLIGRLHSSVDRGDGRTKYILKGEGAGSVFVIDSRTGNIHVTKPLDREEKDQYRLIATATDRQTGRALEPSSQFIIRVQDINDNPPVFQGGPYSATVPEMANIGTSVIQVTATDADDPTYGNSAKLVYSVIQGQQYFTVDPQSGIVRTAVPDMDREAQAQYQVVLQARDMGGHQGGLTGTTTLTVHLSDVNDNPPRFTQSMWSFSVSELAVPGVEIGRMSATDADLGENARMDFMIVDGEAGDTFNITGLNQEAVILLNKAVDYERRSTYSLAVEVQNPNVDSRFLRRGPFKDRAMVRITVLNADEPPKFSRSRYRLDVSENCPPACVVGRVAAVDPDTGLSNNIKYSIDPESDPEALFRIASDSGLITTTIELDREQEQWHNITVIATQRDSPNQVTRVSVAIETLDLNDNAPELDRQYNTAVCDSSAAGQVATFPLIRFLFKHFEVSHHGLALTSLVAALSLSLRRQKRDTQSPVEDDEIRENIITYDDEGGGEADTAAFDIATLKSAPQSILGLDPRRPVSAPLYGRYCYSIQTLPASRNRLGPFNSRLDLAKPAYVLPGSQGQAGGPLESGSVFIGKSRDGSEHKRADGSSDSIPKESETGSEVISESHTLSQDQVSFLPQTIYHITMPFRTMEGTLLRGGGGIPLTGTTLLYPEAAGQMGLYGVGGQNYVPHLVMPLPGGAGLYERGWGLGNGTVGQANSEKAGVDSLTNRMGDFLQHRLALVTFDPMQPPYDSLQTYGLEGGGSQATSLSSLESEAEKDTEGQKHRFEEWGPKFDRLLDIFRERAKEKVDNEKHQGERVKEEHLEQEMNKTEDESETEMRKEDETTDLNETQRAEEENTEELEAMQ
uniref:Cadherin 24, type 2a n=1 Tax=Cyprinus carpio TaxID=7962 RepID=A0A8C1GFG0_CYPCA